MPETSPETLTASHRGHHRPIQAILDVLPRAALVEVPQDSGVRRVPDLLIGGQPVEVKWVGEGTLGRVTELLRRSMPHPGIVVARQFSPGARQVLSELGIGWVDETGAAEIALGPIIVSKSGRARAQVSKPQRWTRSVLAVAEALLVGCRPTVADTAAATGLATGSCTSALRFLTSRGLLTADAPRGRHSARRLTDRDKLVEAYAAAAEEAAGDTITLSVGITSRDPVDGMVEAGCLWERANLSWAATGLAAAAVMAPLVTNVTSVEAYVDAYTPAGLEAVAGAAGLRPIDGGRLTLSSFPTVAAKHLASTVNGLRVAPWPRVFVDIRRVGVRGEEAAEHLREVMGGP